MNDFLKDSSNSEDSIIAVKGEVRLLIALTIILILGIALFQLIVTTGADDFVKSILGVTTGAITTIIGFYFGSKASKEGGEKPTDTSKAQGGNGSDKKGEDHRQKAKLQTGTQQTPTEAGAAATPSDQSVLGKIENRLSQLEEATSSFKKWSDDLVEIKANLEKITGTDELKAKQKE